MVRYSLVPNVIPMHYLPQRTQRENRQADAQTV